MKARTVDVGRYETVLAENRALKAEIEVYKRGEHAGCGIRRNLSSPSASHIPSVAAKGHGRLIGKLAARDRQGG